ncbi:MAG: RagB/SusD family nutrient uptake outer membrane protein [Chryseobacterium sp.]|nr:RagB/SusD family nutrient uptake outer membrane protein [Chryseobacterium sp.]
MNYKPIIYILIFSLFSSCKKEWLDEKPSKSLVVPESIANFQALLDNEGKMNGFGGGSMPVMGELTTDDYEMLDNTYTTTVSAIERNCYTFKQDIYEGSSGISDWNSPYEQVFYSNVALEGLEKIKPTTGEVANYNNVKGSAYFFRAHAFFSLAQYFAKQYHTATANSDLGIILKLKSEIGFVPRSSVSESYQQIIRDLLEAEKLLPNVPLVVTRPSRAAVFALLSRVYLVMGDYDNALKNANDCLAIKNKITDFNNLNAAATIPFTPFNEEVIFSSNLNSFLILIMNLNYCLINPNLYNQYDANDLRKGVYFRQTGTRYAFKGSFNATYSGNFAGLATDEVLLTRAECLARTGNISGAMKDLNDLMIKRYKINPLTNISTYVNQIASDEKDALKKIFTERRKELLFRGIRWLDLRRLNSDSRFAVTLSRTVNGKTYTLGPNDPRYIFSIPDDEIRLNPNPQNIR